MSRSRRSRKPNNTQFFAAVAVDKNLESKLTLFDSDKKNTFMEPFFPGFLLDRLLDRNFVVRNVDKNKRQMVYIFFYSCVIYAFVRVF